MENNKFLQAQEAVDVSVLLKNVSNDIAFQLVVNLFTEAHKEVQELEEYFDYIWIEYGNGTRWDFAVEKHNHSQSKLCDLEKVLGNLFAEQAKDWEGIPRLIGDMQIDIKYLLYEMPSDLGIDFINNYLEHIEDVLRLFELEKDSKNDTDERKRDAKSLIDLQSQLIAIRNDEANSEIEWQKELKKLEEAEEKERQEMREWINKTNHEMQVSESVVGDKEVVAAMANADDDKLPF